MTHLGPTGGMGRRKGKGRGKERKRMRELSREKLYLLSKFLGDRTVGFRRSKKESSFSQQELHIETGIMEFWQTPRGRGFSLTYFSL